MKKEALCQVKITSDDGIQSFATEVLFATNQISFIDDNNQPHQITKIGLNWRYQKLNDPYVDFYFGPTLTEGIYRTGAHTFVFEIKTLAIELETPIKTIKYQLRQNQTVISTHEITIHCN